MPYFDIRRKLILVAAISAMLLGACSSPAVTGMKVHMQNQDYDAVIHLADSIIATGDSLDPEVWFWRGKAFTETNRWADASESFWMAYTHDAPEELGVSEYWFTFFNSAVNTLSEGDTGRAVQTLERGMQTSPERPDFQMMLGDIELSINNDRQGALDNFQEASDKAMTLIADIQRIMNETRDPYELDFYSQSLAQARSIMLLSLYNTGSVLTMMSMDAENEEDRSELIRQAREAYYRALEVDPANVDMLDALADLYLIEEDYQSALEIYEEALVNIEIGVSEGWMEPEEAEELKAGIMVSRGYAFIEMGDHEGAIFELEAARRIIGDDYIILSSLAHANFVMENYGESLASLEEVLSIEGLTPDELSNAYYMMYASYNRLERDEDAARAMETAIQFRPDNANYWRYLASTYSRLGRRNDAIEALERAEELESGN